MSSKLVAIQPIEINGERAMQYIDRASRWNGHGNTEFRSNLDLAKDNRSIIRAIIARTNSPESVERGDDASKLKNTFATKEDWVGTLTKWDSDNFEIVFTLHKKCYFAEHFIKKKNAQIDS